MYVVIAPLTCIGVVSLTCIGAASCRQVVYSAEALLEKNKDFVVAEHTALIRNSASYFVRCFLFCFSISICFIHKKCLDLKKKKKKKIEKICILTCK